MECQGETVQQIGDFTFLLKKPQESRQSAIRRERRRGAR